ncbi:MAG: DNA replication/repair protein RecF [Pseudomonadales bacterium]|nr:DNA replication/repair protein RecF [Pseudomonadales bacterium]
MTTIQRFEVDQLRNLLDVKIMPSAGINVLHGSNGSGKTSLLEAVYMLGVGRSFRSNRLDPVINEHADQCVVYAELEGQLSIGFSKSRKNAHILKLQGNKQRNWSDVARHMPLQIINSDSFLLLEGGPGIRRRFLDWGVFHVEQDFLNNWRNAGKCLANRNQLLKMDRLDTQQLLAWDNEFTELATKIDEARQHYIEEFIPQAIQTVAELIEISDLGFSYYRGWAESKSYSEVLLSEREKDQRYGSTQFGPHRADIHIRVGRRPAAEVLSRGQQKLLVSALKIAQGIFLSRQSGRSGVYLVDDLPSELDVPNRARVCGLLHELDAQVFMSCVDINELENKGVSVAIDRKFHVEHGKIRVTD